jgi:hypothetical protein
VQTALQIAGAVLLLLAFGGVQIDRLDSRGWTYLAMNAIGGSTLAVLAAIGRDWGFLLLEGTWGLVATGGMVAKAMRPGSPS